MRDWMRNSATSPVSVQDWEAFERSPEAYHLRACGDLATWVKHAAVSHEVRHVLALEYSGEYIDGDAIPFRAIRVYFEPRTKQEQKDRVVRVPSANVDNYPDASEMIRRAFRELTTFIAPHRPTL